MTSGYREVGVPNQDVQDVQDVHILSIKDGPVEYEIDDNVIIEEEEKQTKSRDFNQEVEKLPNKFGRVNLNDESNNVKRDNLQHIDINSLPIIFDECAETIPRNNLVTENNDFDSMCTNILMVTPLVELPLNLDKSFNDKSTKIHCIQTATSNNVQKNSDKDIDPGDTDYIPEIENYSDSSEDEELENRINPVRMHIGDEDDTAQIVQIDQNEKPNTDEPLAVDYGNMLEGRKRGIKRQIDQWAKNKTKRLRMEGKPYMGYSRKNGKVSYNIPRESRKLGPPCTSKECVRVKSKHCSEITEEERLKIFLHFWNEMNWDQRKIFFINHVKMCCPNRTYTREDSRRKNTMQYFLTVDNKQLQVCKKMFLQTLCIGEYSVQDWVKKGTCGMTSSTESTNKRKKPSLRAHKDADKVYLSEFFDKLPKLPSHYARTTSSKLYLETTVESLNHLFNLYIETCKSNNHSPLSRTVFSSMFHAKNLSLYPIKKDKCDLCTQHEVGQLSDEKWNDHRLKKERAREEKNKDKEEAKSNTQTRVLTIDLQAVKVCPFVQASAIYFKLKLSCHNFTVFDTVSHQATCFWFTETEADMTASTFASCLLKYLETNCQHASLIIIYSDGCTYQNRNNIMSNAVLNYAVANNVQIVQKFFVNWAHPNGV